VSSEEARLVQVRTIYFLKQDLNRLLELPTEPERTHDEFLERAINHLGTFPDLSMISPGHLSERSLA
jgi:hypothetical protein